MVESEEPPAQGCSAWTGLRIQQLYPNTSGKTKKENVVFPSGRAARAAPIASLSRHSQQLNPRHRQCPVHCPHVPRPGVSATAFVQKIAA